MEAAPEVFPVFQVFTEMGIAVTDGEKVIEEIDEELLIDIELRDSVSLDDPVRMFLTLSPAASVGRGVFLGGSSPRDFTTRALDR